MAGISFTRPSAGTVRYSATGLALDHEYKIQVQSGGTWYDKASFTAERTSQSGSFSVDSSGSYSGRLYSVTLGTVLATATIPAYSDVSTATIYAQCAAGVSQFTLVYGSSSTIVRATAGVTSVTVTKGTAVSIRSVYTEDGYESPYILSGNTASAPGSWDEFAIEFTSTYSISDTSFDRRLKVGATAAATYPYEQRVYVDDSLVTTTTNSANTADSVRISALSNYSYYENQGYLFEKAVAGGTTYTSPAGTIALTKNTTTIIRLYFTSPERAVAPTITSVSVTATAATVYWSKNGGTYGQWQLYYGRSTDSMSLWGSITTSPVTVTGLEPGTSYSFMVRNYVSASDAKESGTYTAKTKNSLSSFAWTDNDAGKIARGQPVTNLKASAWNTLMNLINRIRTANGLAALALPTAAAGGAITAENFNTAANAIRTLNGAGTVASAAQGGTVYATHFANSTTALKEAVNRAVDSANA